MIKPAFFVPKQNLQKIFLQISKKRLDNVIVMLYNSKWKWGKMSKSLKILRKEFLNKYSGKISGYEHLDDVTGDY